MGNYKNPFLLNLNDTDRELQSNSDGLGERNELEEVTQEIDVHLAKLTSRLKALERAEANDKLQEQLVQDDEFATILDLDDDASTGRELNTMLLPKKRSDSVLQQIMEEREPQNKPHTAWK